MEMEHFRIRTRLWRRQQRRHKSPKVTSETPPRHAAQVPLTRGSDSAANPRFRNINNPKHQDQEERRVLPSLSHLYKPHSVFSLPPSSLQKAIRHHGPIYRPPPPPPRIPRPHKQPSRRHHRRPRLRRRPAALGMPHPGPRRNPL